MCSSDLSPLEVITHHGVPKDVQPQLAQPLGQHLGISVGDISQKQLGPPDKISTV